MKHNLYLALIFAQRDLKERYLGTSFGQLWLILSPLVMIFIYTIIFSDFMKMKLEIVENSYAYSIYLVPGLLAWTAFSTTLMRLNTVILEKAELIKKISVPIYTFQLAIVITELINFTVALILGLLFLWLVNQPITPTFLWLLPLMGLQALFAWGLGTLFSLFTPFFKDLKEIVPIGLQLWFWMTPIIYLKSMIEHKYPYLVTYNPFYPFLQAYQDLFLYAKAPSFNALLEMTLLAVLPLMLAAYLYKKMVPTIKDII